MLTKEERTAIAERANECVAVCGSLYEVLLGHRSACNTTYEEDMKKLLARIVELCDTSNMIELPVDKDGEVIHIGDTLYDDDGTKIKVCGFLLHESDRKILLDINANNGFVVMSANKLTHKRPVTIASLVGEIRRTLSQNTIMNKETTAKLWEITDQIEMLSDSDD